VLKHYVVGYDIGDNNIRSSGGRLLACSSCRTVVRAAALGGRGLSLSRTGPCMDQCFLTSDSFWRDLRLESHSTKQHAWLKFGGTKNIAMDFPAGAESQPFTLGFVAYHSRPI